MKANFEQYGLLEYRFNPDLIFARNRMEKYQILKASRIQEEELAAARNPLQLESGMFDPPGEMAAEMMQLNADSTASIDTASDGNLAQLKSGDLEKEVAKSRSQLQKVKSDLQLARSSANSSDSFLDPVAIPAVSPDGCKRPRSPLPSEGTADVLAKRQRSLLGTEAWAFSLVPRDGGGGNYSYVQDGWDSAEKSALKAGAFAGMSSSYDGGGGKRGDEQGEWKWAEDCFRH
jgi:hypothetical protein